MRIIARDFVAPRNDELDLLRDCQHNFRHCERSEAIQDLSAEAVWIASLRSQ
ncbi:hypothetical protein [Bradyrhizobium sp. AS23.2]|uniref:hypothetical protein n=1 Tax=Bradyrhizobium sp. AS23.2 TaxID=1680155 RepID=UPI00142FB0A9|nr:hypothetical protein [Bradyrhizobium sp. AS23.2]